MKFERMRHFFNILLVTGSLFLINACATKMKSPILLEQNKIVKVACRGLSMVSDDIIWGSGRKGTYLFTTDGGRSWWSDTIKGATHLDFRDIEALGKNEAIVLSAGEDARIYKTTNSGETWALVYHDTTKGVFFDGMAFWDKNNGIAFSDPIDNDLLIIRTIDGGNTWRKVDTAAIPNTLEHEAGFAASGTSIKTIGDKFVWIATGGGAYARVFKSSDKGYNWDVFNTPLASGKGTGIFSMEMFDEMNGVIVGGNFMDSTNKEKNCAITFDGGRTWKLIEKHNPKGYRSCVTKSNDGSLVFTVGRTGLEYSKDKGNTWKHISDKGYYSVVFGDEIGWTIGRGGRMAKIILE